MPAGFLRHTARPLSVRPCGSRSPSPPQRPRALLSLPSPALTSRTARSGGGGGWGAGLRPPRAASYPQPGLCHAPTLADLGDLCWEGVGRGVEKGAAEASEDSVRGSEKGVKGPWRKSHGQGCAGTRTSISRRGQKKLCGSLSHHVHKVAGDGMNEGCGMCSGSECSWEARALGTFE